MNLAVVTGHTPDYQTLADVTLPFVRRYCERQGYTLMYDPAFREDEKAYGKLRALLRAFDEGADRALWIDTDAIITNPDIRFETICDQPAGITLTADILGTNTGVMIVQDCPKVQAFFWACLGYGRAWHGINGWAEQTSIREFMKTPPYSEPGFIRHVPQKTMNSYAGYADGRPVPDLAHCGSYWTPGDFILHLPGMPNEARLRIIGQFETNE